MSESIDPELLELTTKLFNFAREGDAASLASYVDAGVSANLTNEAGDSLVMLAAYHGHEAVVRALLERGADPNKLNDKGQSPLAGAVFKNEIGVITALVEGGADPDAGAPSAGQTAVMFGKTDLVELFANNSAKS
jgi:ankyrin repeat protein